MVVMVVVVVVIMVVVVVLMVVVVRGEGEDVCYTGVQFLRLDVQVFMIFRLAGLAVIKATISTRTVWLTA